MDTRYRLQRALGVLTLVFALSSQSASAANLPLPIAVQAATAAVEACKTLGFQVTVTVLDSDLSTRVVLRDDGAGERTVQIGYRKAYTVIKTGMSSGEFGKTVPIPPPLAPGALPGPVNGDTNLITYAGGVAIKAHGELLGALAVSGAPGGEKDEVCALKAIAVIAESLK